MSMPVVSFSTQRRPSRLSHSDCADAASMPPKYIAPSAKRAATVRRFYYDSHDALRGHLNDFITAYNFARRLKTLKGLTPYEFICKCWTKEPDRFNLDPIHQCRD